MKKICYEEMALEDEICFYERHPKEECEISRTYENCEYGGRYGKIKICPTCNQEVKETP